VTPDLPPGMTPEQFVEISEEANDWHAGLAGLRPGSLRFNLKVATAAVPTPDGPAERKFVRLHAYQPTGVCVMHLPPEMAEALAEQLVEYAMRARTGLVISQALAP
jgi:hypothetical protein